MINPPTIYLWANWFMTQWDIYMENSAYAKNHNVNLFTKITLLLLITSLSNKYFDLINLIIYAKN